MWKIGTARMEVESAGETVIDETINIALARVAVASSVTWGAREELEDALWVEGVTDGGGGRREGTMLVEVVVA